MIRPAVALLALTLTGGADGPNRLTLDVRGRRLGEFVQRIGKHAGLRVEVDDKAAQISISLRLRDVSPETVIRCIALKARVQLESTNNGHRITATPLSPKVDRLVGVLTKHELTLPKAEMTLAQILKYVRSVTKCAIVTDSGLQTRDQYLKTRVVLGRLGATSALELLAMAAEKSSLDWDLRWGTVLLSTKARLAQLPRGVPDGGALARKLSDAHITLHVDDITIAQGLDLVGMMIKPIEIDKQARDVVDKRKVTLEFSNLSLENTLAHLLFPHGLRYEVKRGRIVILKAG